MKVLVIQQKMIGDVLTSSILFEALKRHNSDAKLHYLVYRHTIPVVAKDPHIDKIIPVDGGKDTAPLGLLRLAQQLRKERYDLVIDVYSKISTAFLSLYSGAGERISFRKWYTRIAYTNTVQRRKIAGTPAGLAIENRMQLLQQVSNDFPLAGKPKIWLNEDEKKAARELLFQAGVKLDKPLIMCAILGSSPSKTYPLGYMGDILDFIVNKTDAQLLFNYIPEQKKQAQKVLQACSESTKANIFLEVCGKNLRDFMAVTAQCHALIGNEGGAVNMAKALNIPTFAIFSPQIKKMNWSIYEDGRQNVSVHLDDFYPEVLRGLTKKEILKKNATFYELLAPNLIFASLEGFLQENNLSFTR